MKKRAVQINLRTLLFFALAMITLCVCVTAQQQERSEQNEPLGTEAQQQNGAQQQANDPINLVQELNLTPDQQAQLRALKEEHQVPIREALRRRNRAKRALQEAIYAENADDATIGARTRELSAAQADLAHLQTSVELRIRRILTPEQLEHFRAIRQQRLLQRGAAGLRPNRQMQGQRDNLPNAGAQSNQSNGAVQNQQMRRQERQQMRIEKRIERQNNRQTRQNRAAKPLRNP